MWHILNKILDPAAGFLEADQEMLDIEQDSWTMCRKSWSWVQDSWSRVQEILVKVEVVQEFHVNFPSVLF